MAAFDSATRRLRRDMAASWYFLGLSTGLYRPVDRPPHAEVRLARSRTVFISLMALSALLVRFARTTPFRRKADAVLVYGHIGAVLRYIRLS